MDVSFSQRLVSFFGLFAMVGIAWLLSHRRDRVPWRVIAWGIGLQVSFGVLVMKTDAGLRLFSVLNDVVLALLEFTAKGTEFVFGDFATEKFTIVVNVLPTLIFFSSLMTILYYLGLMQRVVGAFAWVMRRTMRTSGPETLSVAANTFVGQTEAPLMVAPFIGKMTMSELNAVMTGGFATVAGGVLAAYVGLLKAVFPDIAGHLIRHFNLMEVRDCSVNGGKVLAHDRLTTLAISLTVGFLDLLNRFIGWQYAADGKEGRLHNCVDPDA